MFGGMNPKQMQAAMKKLGIKTEEFPAEEVIIKGEKTLIIKNPQVTIVDMKGQKTFQIMGEVEEMAEEKSGPSEEDVKLVMEQSGADEETAKKALEETGGDIAEAIMKLKK